MPLWSTWISTPTAFGSPWRAKTHALTDGVRRGEDDRYLLRPSCPARTPKRENVRFLRPPRRRKGPAFARASAAGQTRHRIAGLGPAGGSRRARDAFDRRRRGRPRGCRGTRGAAGLHRAPRPPPARRYGRAGPLSLARAQRAQTARILLETTTVPITGVAFAAGFRACASSMRRFEKCSRWRPVSCVRGHGGEITRRSAARYLCVCPTELRSTERA